MGERRAPEHDGVLDRILEVCDDALGRLGPGDGHRAVERIRAKLLEPLQVTVAGSVSSGKSTLVNALLGQRVAAVDAGECTRVVTWFRYDHHERAEAQLATGERVTVPLRDGALPERLGAPTDQVQRLVVYLSNAGLKRMSLVDTPGLNTVTEANEAATADFLGVDQSKEGGDSALAIGQADALVFLMPHLQEADAEVLRGFRDLYDGTGLSAANAIGVLSKVDRLTRTADPLDAARPIAARVAGDLRGLVSDVVPLVGLLAETANAARFTEEDARDVARLAEVEDELDREDMLLSPDDFLEFDGIDLATATRRRLLRLLDLYGLQVALTVADRGERGASSYLRAFDERSGFAPLRAIVLDRFARQADLLKAHVAICDLRRASYLRTDPDNARALRSLRGPLERIELDPELHQLRVLEAMQAAANDEWRPPDALMADLEALCSGRDLTGRLGVARLDDAADAALAGAARWGAWAGDPRRSPKEARLGRLVKEAYEVLWSQVDRAAGA